MLQPRSELLDRSDPSPCSSTLGIERRKFEGLAGVGFGAGPTFNIMRRNLVVRAAADGGGARMPMR